MNKTMKWIAGSAIGAGLMYFLDPTWGRRRRSLVRDKAVHFSQKTRNAAGPTARDLGNRLQGLVSSLRFGRGPEASDEVVVARVRSALGRVVAHPHAIRVEANDGRVTLSGPILAAEEPGLIDKVTGVAGVREIENRLELHKQAGDVPALQGGVGRREERFELMQANWTPAIRCLVGSAGAALALYGLKRRGLTGAALAAAGIGMCVRGATNLEMKRLVGVGGGRRAVDIQKSITLNAPVDHVFDLWSSFENFPRFMSHVRKIEDLGEGRSRWTVAGPAGLPIEWTAIVTEQVPNQVLAWKTEQGSGIQHAGIVHFEAAGPATTRVHIRLSYNPPAGAAGHAVASLLGFDPKSEMDADLVRMKTFVETGVIPHDAAAGPVRVEPIALRT